MSECTRKQRMCMQHLGKALCVYCTHWGPVLWLDPCVRAWRWDIHHCSNNGHAAPQGNHICRGNQCSRSHDSKSRSKIVQKIRREVLIILKSDPQTGCRIFDLIEESVTCISCSAQVIFPFVDSLKTHTLFLLQVISSALGIIVPALLSPKLTHNAATALYTIFGVRLLYVAWKSGSDEIQVPFFQNCCGIHQSTFEFQWSSPL